MPKGQLLHISHLYLMCHIFSEAGYTPPHQYAHVRGDSRWLKIEPFGAHSRRLQVRSERKICMQGPTSSRDALQIACSDFLVACSDFQERHSILQLELAIAKVQASSLEMSEERSKGRMALERARERKSSTQRELESINQASEGLKAQCTGMRFLMTGVQLQLTL